MLHFRLSLITLLFLITVDKLVASQRHLRHNQDPTRKDDDSQDFTHENDDSQNLTQKNNIPLKPLLTSALPLAWLHIPKAGSSLANAIIHTPGICSGLEDIIIKEETFKPNNAYGWGMLSGFNKKYPVTKYCAGSLAKWGYHAGVGKYYESLYKGHGIVMFRQPEKRIVSSWNGYHHSLSDLLYRLKTKHMTIREYAEWIQGCAVRMLVRTGGYETCVSTKWPSQAEMNMAISRLREGFVFVGLTEEWQLSMCLFRKMFGGRCNRGDILNIRPERTDVFNATISDLEGFTDRYDGKLYKVAKKIFEDKLSEFGLTKEICQQCYDQETYL